MIKVVINDIEYEISSTMDYVKYLEKELNRFKKIQNYINKINESKKQSDIAYYNEYIKMLLKSNESVEDLQRLSQEFIDAYNLRKDVLKKLNNEIKIIKKLKV